MTIQRVELPQESRRPREHAPRYIILHTTQGQTTIDKQAQATVNWFSQRGGRPASDGWGPSADILIDHLGNETFFTLDGQDFHATRANWSAGRGAAGTYPADEYGIAIEMAQTHQGERPPDATLRAAVNRCAYLCITFGIPAERIEHLTQQPSGPVQRGIVGHEDTANGRFTGKWDPNRHTFPWAWFAAEVQAEVERRTAPAPVLTDEQRQVVEWLASDAGQLLPRTTRQHVLVQAGLPRDYPVEAPPPEPVPEPAPPVQTPPADTSAARKQAALAAITAAETALAEVRARVEEV